MKNPISPTATAQLFTEARSYHAWQNKPVSDEILKQIYDLTKWGPTSVNGNPARIIFVKSAEQKEKLYPAVMGSNVEQIKQAPVTAILAFDEKWLDHIGRLMPAMNVRPYFEGNTQLLYDTVFIVTGKQIGRAHV